MAGQQELMLDVQQALPGEGVQEVVELVLGVGDIVLCKRQLCSYEINARPLFPKWWQNDPRRRIVQESNWKIDRVIHAYVTVRRSLRRNRLNFSAKLLPKISWQTGQG